MAQPGFPANAVPIKLTAPLTIILDEDDVEWLNIYRKAVYDAQHPVGAQIGLRYTEHCADCQADKGLATSELMRTILEQAARAQAK